MITSEPLIFCSECGKDRKAKAFYKSDLIMIRPICKYCRNGLSNKPLPIDVAYTAQKKLQDLNCLIAEIEYELMYGGKPENERSILLIAMNDLTDQLLYPKNTFKTASYTITMKEGILSISDIKYK